MSFDGEEETRNRATRQYRLCFRKFRQTFQRDYTRAQCPCSGWANPPQNRRGQGPRNRNHSSVEFALPTATTYPLPGNPVSNRTAFPADTEVPDVWQQS